MRRQALAPQQEPGQEGRAAAAGDARARGGVGRCRMAWVGPRFEDDMGTAAHGMDGSEMWLSARSPVGPWLPGRGRPADTLDGHLANPAFSWAVWGWLPEMGPGLMGSPDMLPANSEPVDQQTPTSWDSLLHTLPGQKGRRPPAMTQSSPGEAQSQGALWPCVCPPLPLGSHRPAQPAPTTPATHVLRGNCQGGRCLPPDPWVGSGAKTSSPFFLDRNQSPTSQTRPSGSGCGQDSHCPSPLQPDSGLWAS